MIDLNIPLTIPESIKRKPLKKRNRNYVSAMRKKIELFENLKKERDKIGNSILSEDRYKECEEALLELSMEFGQMSQELNYIKQLTTNQFEYEDNIRRSIDYLNQNYETGHRKIYDIINEIWYITQDISIRKNGKNIKMGDYKISIKLPKYSSDEITVSCQNLSRKIEGLYDHPHIQCGHICWGESYYILRCAISGNLDLFAQEFEKFLRTYNPDSPYRKLEWWEEITCSGCGFTGECLCGM